MSTSSAKLLVFISDKLACVKITGRANFTSSIDFKTLLNELIEQGFICIVLDLAECVLMDSTFLGVLSGFGMRISSEKNGQNSGRSIELLNPNPRVAELLENLGVMHLFHLVTGPDSALAGGPPVEQSSVPEATHTREEVVSNCLEAHKILMEINPANVAKFKEVAQFLAEDLKKIKNAGAS
jgi:anti-sigma B factor antagonist